MLFLQVKRLPTLMKTLSIVARKSGIGAGLGTTSGICVMFYFLGGFVAQMKCRTNETK